MLISSDPSIKVETSDGRGSATPLVYGLSPAIRAFERAVADLAPTDIPILLNGESGTGKDVFALEIHRRSRRSNEPFLKCNCATLTPQSLPAQLSMKAGDRREHSSLPCRGTLFLDEISHLDFATQDRLLQLLLEADITESGSYLGARVISSTMRNLEEEMHSGRFRRELYYRISGVCLRLPPLRERTEDIPPLLDLFLNKYGTLFSRPAPPIDTAAWEVICRHSWSGNVRELENLARTLVALGDARLALGDLGINRQPAIQPSPGVDRVTTASRNHPQSLKQAAREASRKAERELILKALEHTRWNRKRTALELQISYKALLYKLKQMNLDSSDDSENPAEFRG